MSEPKNRVQTTRSPASAQSRPNAGMLRSTVVLGALLAIPVGGIVLGALSEDEAEKNQYIEMLNAGETGPLPAQNASD